jgi:hypothetical protein
VTTKSAARGLGLTFTARTPEDLAKCVVLLEREFAETVKMDGEDMEVWLKPRGGKRPRPKLERHLGSGFLVATDKAAFLVTAGHVGREMDRQARVSFANRTGRQASLGLAELLALGTRKVRWTFPPHADIAVVRIAAPPAALRGRFLPAELLAAEKAPPSGTFELMIIGFPLGLTSDKRFAPIAKRAHAASGILRFTGDEMGDPADFFLLDQPSAGGYSGAPVFVVPQVQLTAPEHVSVVNPRCVGMVSRTISDETGGQFAAVVPSAAIKQAIATVARRRGK